MNFLIYSAILFFSTASLASDNFCYENRVPWCAGPAQVSPLDCSELSILNPDDFNKKPIMQDTAVGGYRDCASSPSEVGGPRSYYRIKVPVGKVSRIAARSLAPQEMRVLVRAFEKCDDTKSLTSSIATTGPDQTTSLCFKNSSAVDRELIIAVSRYTGEAFCNQLMYHLTYSIDTDPAYNCHELK